VPQSHVATRGLVELVCFSEPLIYTGKARCLFSKICPLICIYSLIMAFGYHGSRKLLPHCAGHVARMPMSRAPRQLLTGWVAHPRPIGCPEMNFGRTPKKALKRNDLPTDFATWSAIVRDRPRWRLLTHSTPTPSPPMPSPTIPSPPTPNQPPTNPNASLPGYGNQEGRESEEGLNAALHKINPHQGERPRPGREWRWLWPAALA